MRMSTNQLALGLASVIVLGAVTPSWAAPVLTNTRAVRSAVVGDVTDVRWRGRGGGFLLGGIGAGLALGAIASSQYYATPYYNQGYYGDGYGPAPVYADPGYVDPGYDYYAPRQRYYGQVTHYDSSGAAIPQTYCPRGAAMQNRC